MERLEEEHEAKQEAVQRGYDIAIEEWERHIQDAREARDAEIKEKRGHAGGEEVWAQAQARGCQGGWPVHEEGYEVAGMADTLRREIAGMALLCSCMQLGASTEPAMQSCVVLVLEKISHTYK